MTSNRFNSLIKRMAKGDSSYLKDIYEDYERLMIAAAMEISKEADLANEIVNDVLLKIFYSAPKIEYKIKSPASWIYRVSYNVAMDYVRRRQRDRTYMEVLVYDVPEELTDALSDLSYGELLDEFGERDRKIVNLKTRYELTFEEIAEIYGQPVSTISTIYYRAINKIRKPSKLNKIIK